MHYALCIMNYELFLHSRDIPDDPPYEKGRKENDLRSSAAGAKTVFPRFDIMQRGIGEYPACKNKYLRSKEVVAYHSGKIKMHETYRGMCYAAAGTFQPRYKTEYTWYPPPRQLYKSRIRKSCKEKKGYRQGNPSYPFFKFSVHQTITVQEQRAC